MCRKYRCVKGPYQFCTSQPLCRGCTNHQKLYHAAAESDEGKRAAKLVLLMAELADQLRDFLDEGHGDACKCPLCAFFTSDRADARVIDEFSHAAWALRSAGCMVDGELPFILSTHDREKRIEQLLAEVDADDALTPALTA